MHVALLGDSTFDNAAYVSRDLDVAMQLRAYLGERWQLSLLAKDGSVLDEVAGQARHMMALPHQVTHLVVSSGGNDLLGLLGGLQLPVASVLEAWINSRCGSRTFATNTGACSMQFCRHNFRRSFAQYMTVFRA